MTAVTQKSVIDAVPKGLFIGGEWRDGSDGARSPSTTRPTGEILTQVADATVEDGRAALDAAVAAQADWARTPPRERGEILRAAFELITERADDFAMLMTLEMGKPLAESRGEVDLRRRVLPVVLRGGRPDPRPLGRPRPTAPPGC